VAKIQGKDKDMKKSAVLLLFLLFISVSAVALSSEVVPDIDDVEVQQVDNQDEGVQAWAPDVLLNSDFESVENQEVVDFGSIIRIVATSSVDANLMSFYYNMDHQNLQATEGSHWTTIIDGQRNATLLCFRFSFDGENTYFVAAESENRPERNRPVLWRL
jgi:hypothetical protein